MGRLALLICVVVVLLSAAMANGIRPAGTVVAGGAGAPTSPDAAVTQTATTADGEITTTTAPPTVATTVAITAPSDKHQDDPDKDSKRKVPNGPDPIHNRGARWGEAPSRRV